MTVGSYGTFPFGQPNRIRPMRRPSRALEALVVGVYPSAFHIAWTPPSRVDPRKSAHRTRPLIASLAVDVEPTVFWDGVDPSPAALLAQWKASVGFSDEQHGVVKVGHNGPSGVGLLSNVLGPLGIDPNTVAFTDVVPWYFVKAGRGSQGAAIRDRYDPIAVAIGFEPSDLPARPSRSTLVRLVVEGRREAMRDEILDASPGCIITLGQEAIDALRGVSDSAMALPDQLGTDRYGEIGSVSLGGKTFEVLPLVHPGFERQTRDDRWRTALAAWRSGLGSVE
jgi:hypothetical protein